MLELGMVSSFHPHSMCKRVERVTAKTGRTSCTNWTMSFGVSGFGWELICYMGTSFFSTYLNSRLLRSVCTIQSKVINFQHVLTSFAIFQSFTDLFRELNDYEIENHYKMNSESVETWHGIIIHPHSMCKIVERVKAKTGRTSWTNWKISFGVSGFRTRTHLLHGHFIFLNLFELQPIFAFSMHLSKRRHQFPTRSDIICCFSVIYRFV